MDTESPVIILEPKYCELCGALWLRPAGAGANAVYCRNCAPRIAALAPIRLRSDQSPEFARRES